MIFSSAITASFGATALAVAAWLNLPLACTAPICLDVEDGDYVVYDADTWTDTFRHADGSIGRQSYRLWGVDATERFVYGGLAAKNDFIDIISGQALACAPRGTSYNRIVVQCFLTSGEDLSCLAAKRGMAWDGPGYSGGIYEECEIARRPLPRPDSRL